MNHILVPKKENLLDQVPDLPLAGRHLSSPAKKRPFSAEKLRPQVEKDTTIPLAAMNAEQEMI